jgi:predicted CxxxxCH...CXXCH cytochrome family protein
VISGLHGNGAVEIVFDSALVSPEASYDRSTGTCAVACHNRGGARGRVVWMDTAKMRCGDCHASPPAQHFPGACVACHREADATGAALSKGALHLNGRVDLGDGSGGCGACHGAGQDPWPTSGAHARHKSQTLTTAVDCSNCHAVPSVVVAPGHLDGVARISFAGRATERGAKATWDGSTCNTVACHGARLIDTPKVVPVWSDTTGAASACGACHGLPPTQHTASTSCDRSNCHGAEVSVSSSGFAITATGKSLHINGLIEPGR